MTPERIYESLTTGSMQTQSKDLSDAQKKALEEQLAKTIGHPVAVDASVKPELIGGVTVTLGSLQIDDSIKSKLERMGRAMKHNGAKAA